MRFFQLRMVLCCLMVCFGLLCEATSNALLEYVPVATDYIVSVDLKELRSLPDYRSAVEANAAIKQQIAGMEKAYGIRLTDCSDLLFVGGGKKLRGLLCDVSISEAQFVQLLKSSGNKLTAGTFAGKRIYFLQMESSLPELQRKLAFVYLAKNVLLATEDDYVAYFLSALKERRNVSLPEGTSLMWGSISLESYKDDLKESQDPVAGSISRGVKRFSARLDLTGVNRREFDLTVNAECKDANHAAMMSLVLPSAALMLNNFLFLDAPKLSEEIARKIKTRVDKNRVILSLQLPEELTLRAGKHLAVAVLPRLASLIGFTTEETLPEEGK